MTIDGLEIQNKGDFNGESSANRGAIYLYGESVNILNNTITNGLESAEGLSNAIQIMSSVNNNGLTNYVITDNTFVGHNYNDYKWASSAIFIAHGKSVVLGESGLIVTATEESYKSLLNHNTFSNNMINLTHQVENDKEVCKYHGHTLLALDIKWEQEEKHDKAIEGTEVGQYTAGSKAIFQTAIDAAQSVYDKADATALEVHEAVLALWEAQGIFDNAVITEEKEAQSQAISLGYQVPSQTKANRTKN